MTPEDLDERLRQWGWAYGEGRPDEWQEDATLTGSHPIAQAMEFAPGTKHKTVSVAWRRKTRREYWVDPIPCTETRQSSGHAVPSGGSSVRFSPQVEQVQRAALALYRMDTERGLVLRAEYCKRGRQGEKAEWVTGHGFPMKLRRYRETLANAKGWIEREISKPVDTMPSGMMKCANF